VRYGPGFKRPSKRVLTLHRQQQPKKLFAADEIRVLLKKAEGQLKAMVLLGINAGLGNNDVGLMELRHLDLKNGWLDYPRPKTAVERRAKLWPETVAAVKDAIANRPTPKDASLMNRVFITKYGQSWAKQTKNSPIAHEVSKLLTDLKVKRKGVGFYSLRHTFETVGGATRDQVAVNYIMGHSPMASDMSAVYREAIEDDRLKAVSDHVRAWLLPPKIKKGNRTVGAAPRA
jgi:integrase